MPKVKQEQIGFEGQRFLAVYHVDGRGTFTVKLPDPVREVLNMDEASALTLEKCQQAFKDALNRYREARTTVQRVILYEVKATAHIMNDANDRCLYSEKDISFCHGAAVAIAAQVFDEQEIKSSDGSVKYRYEKVDDCALNHRAVYYAARFDTWPNERPENRLPYTPEREQFFIKLSRGLEALILQLDQLNEPDKALAFADSGVLALPEAT